ncbi:MAG: Rpn family recombination-promoting nuclease/putative transposase, partial [Treponema sp.]|nr:Rpn family recombination-promoting nuclease/putative transposase [Treponema sp.]
MQVNAAYKDSVFSFLFSDPSLLRELYCALEGVDLSPDVPVSINTLRNVLFWGPVNDISFEIGDKLVVLIEHQSTINPNMALRLLLYIAKTYEKRLGERNLYGSKLIKIPRPEFWVLYNGAAPYPEAETLRLSDAFESVRFLGIAEKTALELEVRVVNINGGRNGGIVRRSKTLAQYSAFIEKVRAFTREMGDKEAGMKAAIRYCREHDILKEFLEKNATEVLNMLLEEYTVEDAMALMREESLEEGREKGLEEGLEKGREEGR